MTTRFSLVTLALPSGVAPESLPAAASALIAACWAGMSRAQLLDRARRLGLRVSLRRLPEPIAGGLSHVGMRLTSRESGSIAPVELVAHVRRSARRRAGARRMKPSLPPARDVRQLDLF